MHTLTVIPAVSIDDVFAIVVRNFRIGLDVTAVALGIVCYLLSNRLAARGLSELDTLRADRQLTRNSDIPCPACAAPCPECGGEGQHPCYAFGCMGGILIHAEEICTRLPVSEPHPESCVCRGSRRIVTQSQPCPVCKGTRIEPCAVCRATGKLSSGRDNLAYAAGYLSRAHAQLAGGMALWRWQEEAPACLPCKGTGWQQVPVTPAERENIRHAEQVQKSLASRAKTC